MKLFSENFGKLLKNLRSVEGWGRKLCRGSKFEVLLKLVSKWVEGQYCVEGPYCVEAKVSGHAEEEMCVKS